MFTKLITASTLFVVLLTSGGVVLSQEKPWCHIKKSDSTIIDLSHLCQDQKPLLLQTSRQPLDPNQGSDGGPPSPPENVLDPSVTLVPGQTQKPSIEVYKTPSELWQQTPDLPHPIQAGSVP